MKVRIKVWRQQSANSPGGRTVPRRLQELWKLSEECVDEPRDLAIALVVRLPGEYRHHRTHRHGAHRRAILNQRGI